MYVLVSSLWVPPAPQTCGAFSGLPWDWSWKRAKMFPGKRVGLSGEATPQVSLQDPLWDAPAYPESAAGETGVSETQRPPPARPQLWERLDFSPESLGCEWIRFVWLCL